MISLTNKEKRSIVSCIVILVLVFVVIEIYNTNYYKINTETLPEKGFLHYKNLETNNSYAITDFMKYISDEEYQKAFTILNENNKIDMFNNNLQNFEDKVQIFKDTYSNLQYSTIFSRDFDKYIDEEIICMICNSSGEVLHSIRFNIRTYKSDKEPKIVILNIN